MVLHGRTFSCIMLLMSRDTRSVERAHLHIYVPSLFIIVMSASLIADALFPTPVYATVWASKIGFALLLLGSVLLYAAHTSSKKIREEVNTTERGDVNFFVGPYAYVRHPGYLGMVLIGIAVSFILNSSIILVSTVVFYLIARTVVIREEQHLLHEDSHVKDGYGEYKKRVKRFF